MSDSDVELAEETMMECSGCQYEGPAGLADYYGAIIDVCPECGWEADETWREGERNAD